MCRSVLLHASVGAPAGAVTRRAAQQRADRKKGHWSGACVVRRRVEPRWQSYAVLPEVVLTTADAPVEVDLAAGGAVQANLVSDKDGERRATLLFQPGTVATVNGQPLPPTINVRATEYTVGADGPKKMPATLPPRSGYTYAVEYGIDEAAEGGGVTFDRPVPAYVENSMKSYRGPRGSTDEFLSPHRGRVPPVRRPGGPRGADR